VPVLEPRLSGSGNIWRVIDTPDRGIQRADWRCGPFQGVDDSGYITLARGERSRLADHASDVLWRFAAGSAQYK